MKKDDDNKAAFTGVLNRVLKSYPPEKITEPLYRDLYNQVVMRCVADVAGVLQATDVANDDDQRERAMRFVGTRKGGEQVYGSGTGSELNHIFKTLADQFTMELLAGHPEAAFQYDKDNDGRPTNSLVARKILEGEQQARELIHGNVAGFTKGIVYTPHPTEFLGDKAIKAQEKLMAVLTGMEEFFKIKGNGRASKGDDDQIYMDHNVRPMLTNALKELASAIQEPVSKQLVIKEEMERSVTFSQREFDSIPGIVDTILAATRSGVSSKMSMEQLAQFGHLLSPQTWSPGDQDSKPDMTVDKLQEGIDLNRRSIMFHYFRTLTALGDNVGTISEDTEKQIYGMMHRLLKTGCDAYAGGDPKRKPTPALAREKLEKLPRFADLVDHDFFMKFENKKNFEALSAQATPYANIDEFIRDLGNLRQNEEIKHIRDKGKEGKPKRQCINVVDSLVIQAMNFGEAALRVQVRQNAKMHEEVLDTLLADLPPKHVPVGIKEAISERHYRLNSDGAYVGRSAEEKDASLIEKLMGSFKSDKAFRESIQAEVKQNLAIFRALPPENAAGYKEKKEALIIELGEQDFAKGRIAKSVLKDHPLPEKDAANYEEEKAKLVYAAGEKHYDMYQTLGTMALAAKNPDRIPQYIIAECRSKTNILEAFFLLKVMESIEAPDQKHKVEIVNLVEHPDLVKAKESIEWKTVHQTEHPDFIIEKGRRASSPKKTEWQVNKKPGVDKDATFTRLNPEPVLDQRERIAEYRKIPAVDMTVAALENKDFLEHQLGIKTFDHLLNSYSSAKKEHRLTVAEAKRTYGIKVEDGDKDREVKGVKMVMGAGSDISKQGSVAAGAMMMNLMQKSRAALLSDKENPMLLLEYTGSGGGPNRGQPVSSPFETVQGQSMRQSPENIGQKTLGMQTRHLLRRIAMNPDESLVGEEGQGGKILGKVMTDTNRRLVAQLNEGNMAGLPQNEDIWQHHTQPRTQAMIAKYENLYNSKEFEAMMSYSANMFADMTKFAARPSERKGAPVKKKGFLAPVNVAETRAIGFGLALNVAGIYAPMFFGGSEYLKTEGMQGERDLLQIYMYDPNAQDTINRMTTGIIMADMDIAWKYQGRAHPPSHNELVKLANTEVKPKNPDEPTREELYDMSQKSLAQIHLEYDKVAGQLLRLHQMINGKPITELSEITDGKQAAKEILALRPIAIREQRSLSLQNIQKSRESLASLFMDMVNGKIDPKTVTKDSDHYKYIIYPSMATCAEDIEHADRGKTKPNWGKAVEDMLGERTQTKVGRGFIRE